MKKPKEMYTWVYGKVEPGWYCARMIWDEAYTRDLRAMGYHMVAARFDEKPKLSPEAV